jgi:hypothetical protein
MHPTVLMATGVAIFRAAPYLVPGPFGYPNARMRAPAGVGNKAIALKNAALCCSRLLRSCSGAYFFFLPSAPASTT